MLHKTLKGECTASMGVLCTVESAAFTKTRPISIRRLKRQGGHYDRWRACSDLHQGRGGRSRFLSRCARFPVRRRRARMADLRPAAGRGRVSSRREQRPFGPLSDVRRSRIRDCGAKKRAPPAQSCTSSVGARSRRSSSPAAAQSASISFRTQWPSVCRPAEVAASRAGFGRPDCSRLRFLWTGRLYCPTMQ